MTPQRAHHLRSRTGFRPPNWRRSIWVGAGLAAAGAITFALMPFNSDQARSVKVAGRCMDAPTGEWATYSGEFVSRRHPDSPQAPIYGKVLRDELSDVQQGEVTARFGGPFAVVFSKLSRAELKSRTFLLQGVGEYLALDKAGQPVRHPATCELHIVGAWRER